MIEIVALPGQNLELTNVTLAVFPGSVVMPSLVIGMNLILNKMNTYLGTSVIFDYLLKYFLELHPNLDPWQPACYFICS